LWCDHDECLGNLVKNTPGPLEELHNQTDVPRAVDENIPEVHDLEGPSAGDLDAGNLAGSMAHDGPCDGLSDSDELLDDTDVIDVSDLQQFSSALQEAQCLAIQVEIENVKGKQKTPKTYQGNSKKPFPATRRLTNHWPHVVFMISSPSWP
jgi:hypothetical protein